MCGSAPLLWRMSPRWVSGLSGPRPAKRCITTRRQQVCTGQRGPLTVEAAAGAAESFLEERDKYYTFSSSSRAMPSVWFVPLLDIFLPTDESWGESSAVPSLRHISEGKKKLRLRWGGGLGWRLKTPAVTQKKNPFHCRGIKNLNHQLIMNI